MDQQFAAVADVLPGIAALVVVMAPVALFVSSALGLVH